MTALAPLESKAALDYAICNTVDKGMTRMLCVLCTLLVGLDTSGKVASAVGGFPAPACMQCWWCASA